MSGEQLLTDLCTICHVNPIKYTCPRCAIHTCSLACVKKHKAWAQCSGIRDPAEYRKRSELATPSSIDKDFNFITNLERSITQADDGILQRGINLAPARPMRLNTHKPKVELEIEQREVSIIRAPKALSRSKQNKTNWNANHKGIMWSVEWICADGERIFGSVLERRTLEEAYMLTVGKKRAQKKRKPSQNNTARRGSSDKIPRQMNTSRSSEQEVDRAEIAVLEGSSQPATANCTGQDGKVQSSELSDSALAGIYFYLHNPVTPSKYKCLIPLVSTDSLDSVLKGRSLIEFPTIYALYIAPEKLEEPFISQDDYESKHGADILLNMTAHLEDGEVDESGNTEMATGLDPQKVMQVLVQDLTT